MSVVLTLGDRWKKKELQIQDIRAKLESANKLYTDTSNSIQLITNETQTLKTTSTQLLEQSIKQQNALNSCIQDLKQQTQNNQLLTEKAHSLTLMQGELEAKLNKHNYKLRDMGSDIASANEVAVQYTDEIKQMALANNGLGRKVELLLKEVEEKESELCLIRNLKSSREKHIELLTKENRNLLNKLQNEKREGPLSGRLLK